DLGIRVSDSCAIDVDDGDGVTFKRNLLTFSIRRDDPPPVGTRSDAPGADLSWNADNLRRLIAGQRLFEIDHRHVIRAPVGGEQIALAVTAVPEGNPVRVRKAAPCGVRREQRDRSRRTVRRYERNGKSRAWKPGITECELDLASKTAGPSIDERDSVAAIL